MEGGSKDSSKKTVVTGRKPDILNLVGLTGPLRGRVYDKRDLSIHVGREKGRWKMYLDDPFVSQKHARLYWDSKMEVWMIQDKTSRNGTYLNLLEVRDGESLELRDGDIVEFGDSSRFEVQISPNPEGRTKGEFFLAEIEIFIKKMKARTEFETIRMLNHWKDVKIKTLERAGYQVEVSETEE